MRLQAQSQLDWQKNDSATEHTLTLSGGLDLSEIFQSRDPALELKTRGDDIRRQIFERVLHDHLSPVFTDTGRQYETPGRLNARSQSRCTSSWAMRGKNNAPNVSISNDMKVAITIQTDRSVHAVQALFCSRGAVADAIAGNFMGILKHQYLGIDKTAAESEFDIQGSNVDYKSCDKEPVPAQH